AGRLLDRTPCATTGPRGGVPRSRLEVRRRLQRGVPIRGSEGDTDTRAGTQRERPFGAVGADAPLGPASKPPRRQEIGRAGRPQPLRTAHSASIGPAPTKTSQIRHSPRSPPTAPPARTHSQRWSHNLKVGAFREHIWGTPVSLDNRAFDLVGTAAATETTAAVLPLQIHRRDLLGGLLHE